MSQSRLFSVLVDNKPGVLQRVASMIRRRGFNINSLSVGPTDDDTISRMTITVHVGRQQAEQATKQLAKLIDVITIDDITGTAQRGARAGARADARAAGGAHRAAQPRRYIPGPHRRRRRQLGDHRGHRQRREDRQLHRADASVRHQGTGAQRRRRARPRRPGAHPSHGLRDRRRRATRPSRRAPRALPATPPAPCEATAEEAAINDRSDVLRRRRGSAGPVGPPDRRARLRLAGPRTCAQPA